MDFEGTPSRPMPLDGIERRDPTAPVTRADLARVAENVQRQFASGDLRMGAIESQLRLNTSMTAETKALLDGVEFGLKVIGVLGRVVMWAGRIAAAIGAIYGAFYMLTHGGQSKP